MATYTASDPERAMILWSLEGTDDADFTIVGGVLRFKESPNFEAPSDVGGDNMYARHGRTASDGDNTTTESVEIAVKNGEEEGMVTLSTLQPQVGKEIGAALSDPDGGITDTTWMWFRGSSVIADESAATYTPVAGDVGSVLTAKATYTDGKADEDDKKAQARSSRSVRGVPTGNIAPAFPDQNPSLFGEQTAQERSVLENTPSGRNIGAPVAARDQGDVLTYSIDSATTFDIDRTTGQLKTKAALDFEGETTTYTVTVTATDPSGLEDMAVVTITVTDVDEDPAITTKAETHTAISFMETGTAITTRPSDLCSHRPREFDDQLGCVGV